LHPPTQGMQEEFVNSILGRLLYLTLGAAMFVAWEMAGRWSERGLGERAAATRCAVILVAALPFWWALREINLSLGPTAALLSLAAMGGMVLLWLAAAHIGRYFGPSRGRHRA
jgi:hypothetical protein